LNTVNPLFISAYKDQFATFIAWFEIGLIFTIDKLVLTGILFANPYTCELVVSTNSKLPVPMVSPFIETSILTRLAVFVPGPNKL